MKKNLLIYPFKRKLHATKEKKRILIKLKKNDETIKTNNEDNNDGKVLADKML